MEFKLIHGESLEKLKDLPDKSVDSIVTDGPYGMGEEPDPAEVMADWIKQGYHEVKSTAGGFMGKEWDKFVPQPNLWKECWRVLKPGGYLLCFFSTRTYDWGVMAIRFAGFQIRDQIDWLYGQGFPKNHDISKAIDESMGAVRPSEKMMVGDISGARLVKDGGASPRVERDVTLKVPQTDEAKQWEGWGTALKPAHESIVMARKPFNQTVAENVLEYGTGGINVNACRIETDDITGWGGQPSKGYGGFAGGEENPVNGRWPANIILDDFAAFILDEQSGELTTGAQKPVNRENRENREGYSGPMSKRTAYECEINRGGASRFFYVAKPSKAERNAGLKGFKKRQVSHDGREAYLENPYQRHENIQENFHPTVKPIKLMQYLVRMVTAKGGTCLDPFTGSGTTGCACMIEDINFIGIDQDADCIPLSRARIQFWKNKRDGMLF